jgi:hypothetical protein
MKKNFFSVSLEKENKNIVNFFYKSCAGLLYGRPEFESRLGTPEEALYRAEAIRITRMVLYE